MIAAVQWHIWFAICTVIKEVLESILAHLKCHVEFDTKRMKQKAAKTQITLYLSEINIYETIQYLNLHFDSHPYIHYEVGNSSKHDCLLRKLCILSRKHTNFNFNTLCTLKSLANLKKIIGSYLHRSNTFLIFLIWEKMFTTI